MSTLRVSTIQDTAGSNSSTPSAIANGIAKAWVNFNGTGVVAIRAQYNVSSITDNGVGDYTVNFTTALADANYSCVTQTEADSVNDARWCPVLGYNGRTSSSARVLGATSANTRVDVAYFGVAVFR